MRQKNELSPSIPNVRALLGEVVRRAAASLAEDEDVNVHELIAYAETVLPSVYDRGSAARGGGIAAIQMVLEQVVAADERRDLTCPVDPAWVLEVVNDVLKPVISTLGDANILIPGSVQLLESIERESRPYNRLLRTRVGETGRREARTHWFEDPWTGKQVQLRLLEKSGAVRIQKRFKGERAWTRLERLSPGYARFQAMLWDWLDRSWHDTVPGREPR